MQDGWDITTPEMKQAWQEGRKDMFYPYGCRTYAQIDPRAGVIHRPAVREQVNRLRSIQWRATLMGTKEQSSSSITIFQGMTISELHPGGDRSGGGINLDVVRYDPGTQRDD